MIIRFIIVALALFAVTYNVSAFTTSPLDTLSVLTTVNITGWTPCFVHFASATSQITISQLPSICAGPVLMLAGIQSGSLMHFISYGTNESIVLNNGTSSTVRFFRTDNAFGFTNTTVPSSCPGIFGNSESTLCVSTQNDVIRPGMYMPGTGYTLAPQAAFVVLNNPCADPAMLGTPCTTTLGQCSTGNTCQFNGTCGGGTAIPSPPPDPCVSQWTCNPVTGNFTATYRSVGASCNGTNPCAAQSACNSTYQCVMTQLKSCPSLDQCKATGSCNQTTGDCEYPNVPDGTVCIDDDLCTPLDQCISGNCTGIQSPAPNITCATPLSCDRNTGVWNYTDTTIGTPCVPTSPCVDTEILGDVFECAAMRQCAPTVTTNCSQIPSPVCFNKYRCNSGVGMCVNTKTADGTACSDDNPCTQGTFCSNGTCGGGGPIQPGCPASGVACQTFILTPIDPLTCTCVLTAAPDNVTCSPSSSSLCKNRFRCLAGSCAGEDVLCPGDGCNAPTTCSNVTGCKSPINNGGVCNRTCFVGGRCDNFGDCVGGIRQFAPGCATAGGSCIIVTHESDFFDILVAAASSIIFPMMNMAGCA